MNNIIITVKTYSDKDRLAELVGSQTLANRLIELGITFEKLTQK